MLALHHLYKSIALHEKLKWRRNPMMERNRFMTFFFYLNLAYYAAVLLFLGVVLPMGLRERATGVAAFHAFDGVAYILLIVDFWLRFVFQDTPAHQAKTYALLPIRRSSLMHIYLVRALLAKGNLFWGFLLVPFAFISVYPVLGVSGLVAWLLAYYLFVLAGALCYLLVRALVVKHILWLLLPIVVQAGFLVAILLPEVNPVRLPLTLYIYGMAQGHVLYFLPLLLLLAGLYWVNFKVQSGIVYDDVAKKEDNVVKIKKASRMTYLNRFGVMGEYIKLEIKLRMRNKQARLQAISVIVCIAMLNLIMYFSSAYDGAFMTSFICLYNYIALGQMTLITIMSYEGNYIDALMVRRESILALLHAKYYFSSVLLLVPLLTTLPLIVGGKISVWMSLGYLIFTVGCLYPIIFQLAVYNKETLPLTGKLTGKQASTMQNILSVALLFIPIGFEKLFVLCFGAVWGYVALIAMGLAGVATHRLWLRNIYLRMLSRRYINLEGFHTTR